MIICKKNCERGITIAENSLVLAV
uniref:Uncharacterized protein n=1 Tax=Anguilla anguilla TaxID=7936 RepID=A0A0E9UJV7_ANGAN